MKFLRFVLLFSALAIAPLSPAASQTLEATTSPAIVQSPAGDPSPHVLLAQASSQGALPDFIFGRVIPPANDTILKRDRQRPPAAIGFGFKIAPPANWIVTWTQDVQALALPLAPEETRPQPGAWLLHYRLDPCKAVGLDMPGTPIPVTYEFVFVASQGPLTPPLSIQGAWTPPPAKGKFTLTLDLDTVKPKILSLSAPTTVYRDQTIEVAVSATDVSEEMGGTLVWDSGLRYFRLQGPSNPSQPGAGGSGSQIYTADDSWPTSCDDKVKKADHSFSYTVPHSAQPGQEITLRAEVEDWATNKSDEKKVVLKVEERCRGGARWVGSISGIHKITGHRATRSADSVRLCEGPLEPVGHLIKGHVHTIELRNDDSTITYVHDEAGNTFCRITGQGTSPMMGIVGEISSTLEEIGRNGELRWSQPTYRLSAAPQGTHFYTETCQYGTGTQTNTHSFDAGGWPINIGNDSDDPQSGNRKLEGGRMVGSYATPDGITASWSLTRQGGAPLFPARGRAQ